MLLRSTVEGIGWPALVGDQGARIAAVMFQLEQSQWWPAERIEFVQRQQLILLLSHSLKSVPFYRERLGGRDARPEELVESWRELPILTRSDIQRAGERLFSASPPKGHGAVHKVQTSGSTGQPVELLSSELNRFFFGVFTLRDHIWQQRLFNQTFASIRPDRECEPGGKKLPSWGAPAALLYETGPAALLHSSTPIDEQAAWLLETAPGYLLSMPTNLRALAHYFRSNETQLDSLVQIQTFGESLSSEVRESLKAVFGVPVADMYSTVEIGYIALQCPEHEHYHVQSESALVEVLGEDNQPCRPGEVGRVVVTPLHNYVSPVIRYELGDWAEVGGPCPCGRGLPVIKRILGRQRNLVTLPDGSRHWPSFPEEIWMSIAPITQLQLAQTGSEEIDVRLVMERELKGTEEDVLIQVFSDCLRYPFKFTFSYHDNLLRGRNRKFEDFVSEL